jgi:hypothetical protein
MITPSIMNQAYLTSATLAVLYKVAPYKAPPSNQGAN